MARVATRLGLQSKSFDLAAEGYTDAVGRSISGDSVRRLTEGWGRQVDAQREAEAEQANAPAQRGESPATRRVAEHDPIQGLANVSTDGAMMLVRGEGWKEVKLTAVSVVRARKGAKPTEDRPRFGQPPPSIRVTLSQHSYQAGLWDADTMARHQYAEGLRRGLDRCERLSSVNDGADWIERITRTNFARAVQIVDWSHASQRLWTVGALVFGEGSSAAQRWVEGRLDELWDGHVEVVARCLEALAAERPGDELRQSAGYFRKNVPRMQYAEYRAAGYPIGSGTVESAANTVIHHRLRRPGRGWDRGNGQAMLAALGELHSGRFEQAWQATLPSAA